MTVRASGAGGGTGIRLSALASRTGGRIVAVGALDPLVTGVTQDSRAVQPGDLFVARKGAKSDGTLFIADAVRLGAVAVAAEGELSSPVPVLVMPELARGVGKMAHAVYGEPTHAAKIVGITGTNGKTTTTHLVKSAIDGAVGSEVCGVVGTVGHRFRDAVFEAAHTTPEADTLARVLRDMVHEGASFVAMEASSIALELGRTDGIRFEVAAFTNLTQDHLDFHGDMAAYEASKARLFLEHAPPHAVFHVGDPAGGRLAARYEATGGRALRVSAKDDRVSDIRVLRASFSEAGVEATLMTPAGELQLESKLAGLHNLENLVVTLGIVHALGLDLGRARDALRTALGAPGRLEPVAGPLDDLQVLVDYAHTPDALARVLGSCRPNTRGRLICVFGCGGDRDPTKRGPMGEAAAHGADIAVVTSDNPRTEDPMAIVATVAGAVHRTGARPLPPEELATADRGYTVCPDRREAIELAISKARPGDLVLIAGKGHEDYQILGTEKIHFDDREEARTALAKRRAARTP